jgi:hypothetical protein
MRTTFTVRNRKYELVLEKREPGEERKTTRHRFGVGSERKPGPGHPSIHSGSSRAAPKIGRGEGRFLDDLLASAGARALAAEILIRNLKPDFSFIVDHRWLSQ